MTGTAVNTRSLASSATPVRGSGRRIPARQSAKDVTIPSVLLFLALIYSLLLTQVMSGGFLSSGEIDPDIYVTATSSNAINQTFWLFLFAVSLLAAGMRRTPLMREAWAILPLLLYLAWATATVPWAADRHIALRRLILQFCIVGSVWLPVVMIDNAQRVRELVMYVFGFVVLANAAAIIVVPPTDLGFAGLFSQKNALGALAAMAFVTFSSGIAASRRSEQVICGLGVLAAGFLLVASRSKTSIILAIAVPLTAYAIAFAARGLRIRPGYISSAVLIVGVFAVIFALGTGVRYENILQKLFGEATFTGRTDIWAFAWSEFLTRPIAGFGFNGFWGTGGGSAATFANDTFLTDILQAHNGYLDILLETGLVGLTIFAVFAVVTVGNCRRALQMKGGIFFLSIALFFILHNFFESSAFRRFEPAWIVFLTVAVTVARRLPESRGAAALRNNGATPC